jgi:hypothetical protein
MENFRHMSRVAATVCVVLMISARAAAEDSATPTAQHSWEAIKLCAAIQDDESRHECSDNVLRDAGLMPPREVARRKTFGLQRPAPRETPPVPTPANASEPAPPRAADQLEVTLATVKEGRDGKLTLTTTDGAIWRQVESEPIRPTPAQGQTMTISKGSLGSFMCQPSKWMAFRCARSR